MQTAIPKTPAPKSDNRRNARPKLRWNSLRTRFSFTFTLVLLAIVVLAASGLWGVKTSIEASASARNHWLPTSQALGDLANFTSDYRTAEADMLLAGTSAERMEILREMQTLSSEIAQARRRYEAFHQTAHEFALFDHFRTAWDNYLLASQQAIDLALQNHTADAQLLYHTRSKPPYTVASDALEAMTRYNVEQVAKANERSEQANSITQKVLWVAMLFSALMLILAIAQVQHNVINPLQDLSEAMLQLAANNLRITVTHAERPDEIGDMARTISVFHGNAIDLVQSQQGLERQATMLQEKLQHEQELSRQQHEFVSMVAHEFRTPLAQIDGHAQRLIRLRDKLSPDQVEERAQRVRSAVKRLAEHIDSLLETLRLTAVDTRLFFHPGKIDLTALLHDVCRTYRRNAPDAQIFEVLPATPLAIDGDQQLLAQAVGNLISNAIKYSPDNPTVKLAITRSADSVTITVNDRGIGIAEDEVERIFSRFFRGSNVSGVVGTGIGLFFVATVVKLHNGSIDVKSKLGSGSTFTIRLPLP